MSNLGKGTATEQIKAKGYIGRSLNQAGLPGTSKVGPFGRVLSSSQFCQFKAHSSSPPPAPPPPGIERDSS